ncbi:MAG: hypothetical protein ACE5FQ_16170, partial [Thiogranum sp.]
MNPEKQITRRDFINGVLAGSGASLLARSGAVWPATSPFSEPAPGWYGYGGIGDYASSHGNTPEVVARAHELRDGRFARTTAAIDTGEVFDMV